MIKINLLPQKRRTESQGEPRGWRCSAAATADAGIKQFGLGLGALAALAVIVSSS